MTTRIGWNPDTGTPQPPVVPLMASSPHTWNPAAGVQVNHRHVDGQDILTTSAGIRVMTWPPALGGDPCLVTDCFIENIAASPLGSAKAGTNGAGLWAGHPGTYQRIKVRRAGWEGVWIGGLCRGGTFTDLDIDESDAQVFGVGIYVEHAAQDCDISNSIIIPHANHNAINFEWRYADSFYASFDELHDARAGSCRFKVHNCLLKGPIFVDAGSYGHTFRHLTFVGGNGTKAAISLPYHLPAGTAQSQVLDCDFTGWNGPHIHYHSNAIGQVYNVH